MEQLKIYLGTGNGLALQLLAENVDSGEVAALTAGQMAAISRVRLILAPGTSPIMADSNATGSGAGQPLDWESRAAEGVLVLTLGGLSLPAAIYRECYLLVTFTTNALPIRFEVGEVRVVS